MMNKKNREEYQVEDFLMDESFVSFHFRLDKEHQAFWEEWIIQHPAKRASVKEAMEMLHLLSLAPADNEQQEELTRMKRAMQSDQLPRLRKGSGLLRLLNLNRPDRSSRQKRSVRYLVAAAVVTFLISGYLLVQHFNKPSNSLAERHNNTSSPLVFALSDGTIVTLATHSFLRYPKRFDSRDRDVYLYGEAQFHVSRDVNHPFKVHADDITATVLGTVFNVKIQQGDSIVFVELLEGKLQIEIKSTPGLPIQSLVLNPNERVVYNQYTKNLYKESWQRYHEPPSQKNHLVFHQNNFEEIAKQVKSVFGVVLINRSDKKKWRFTGEFNNTTAKEIMESICLVKGLHAQESGDTILIK